MITYVCTFVRCSWVFAPPNAVVVQVIRTDEIYKSVTPTPIQKLRVQKKKKITRHRNKKKKNCCRCVKFVEKNKKIKKRFTLVNVVRGYNNVFVVK